jgi:hypothetical protein
MNYWLLLEKSDETRVSKGIDGYRDTTGQFYRYDSLVPNFLRVAKDDFVVLRKESEIVGVGAISSIVETNDTKVHRRCPKCESTDVRERLIKEPRWKCGKCAEEFLEPKETAVAVRAFTAAIEGFTKLTAPPSVKAVKMCAAGEGGPSSQLSMLALDPKKVRTLFEGIDSAPSYLHPHTEHSGQGFGLSQAERIAVEHRAMQIAREIYEADGWKMVDVSSSQPYDFLATKNNQNKYVEVKGTTGDGFSVVLTQGEVAHNRRNAGYCALVIVSGIELQKKNGRIQASGGRVSTHEDPWTLIGDCLVPIQFRYNVTSPY